jgi:hypothetical protein
MVIEGTLALTGQHFITEFFEQRGKLPLAAGVLVPKGKDPFGEWELLGYTSAEVNEFAFNALSRRLKVIGVGLPG